MKRLFAITFFALSVGSATAQLPTDTSAKRKPVQKDTLMRDTVKQSGTIKDTVRPIDTISRKVELMRPKTIDDLKDTVPQYRR
jgi:hypothetical protein